MADWYEDLFEGLYVKVMAAAVAGGGGPKQALAVKRLLKVRKGQRVLDIPCGMGRLTLPLATMGLRMIGADLNRKCLNRARRDARREGLDVRFIQSDMREIEFDGEFDAVFNWGGSFGYFPDKGNLAFCRATFRAPKPGGRFLVEGLNKSRIPTHFRRDGENVWNGVKVTTRNRWDGRRNRTHSTMALRWRKKTEQHHISVRIYNGTEIRAFLRQAGFREIKLFSHQPGKRFTRHSGRWIAVGSKP